MGTVYVSQNDSFIGKTDERLTVRFERRTLLDVPLNQEPRRKRTRYETATFGFLQTSQGTGNLPVTD